MQHLKKHLNTACKLVLWTVPSVPNICPISNSVLSSAVYQNLQLVQTCQTLANTGVTNKKFRMPTKTTYDWWGWWQHVKLGVESNLFFTQWYTSIFTFNETWKCVHQEHRFHNCISWQQSNSKLNTQLCLENPFLECGNVDCMKNIHHIHTCMIKWKYLTIHVSK